MIAFSIEREDDLVEPDQEVRREGPCVAAVEERD